MSDAAVESDTGSTRVTIIAIVLAATAAVVLVAAIWLAIQGARLLPDGKFGAALGAFVLVLAAIPSGVGICFLLLAKNLRLGDRVARVLAIAATTSYAAAALLSGSRNVGWVLSALAALAIAGMLAFDPTVRAFFERSANQFNADPTPVVAARIILALATAADALVGLMFLPLAVFSSSDVLWGILFLAIAAGLYAVNRGLRSGSRAARVFLTGLGLIDIVIVIAAGHGVPGVILPVCLAAFVVGLCWIPASSRKYFSSQVAPSQPIVARIDELIGQAVNSMTSNEKTSNEQS